MGFEPVSSMVAFTDGLKDSKRYRIFRLKASSKPDDYAAMHEVLSRRYRRAKRRMIFPISLLWMVARGS